MNNVNVSGPIQPTATYKTKVLKGNHSFASQVTEPNMKYVIKHNFVLDGDVTIPENCILEFDGGSVSGAYTITGANTGIEAGLVKIFGTDITLDGSWNVSEAYPEWFGAKGDGVTDDADAIQKAANVFSLIIFTKDKYNINNTVNISTNEVCFSGIVSAEYKPRIICNKANTIMLYISGYGFAMDNMGLEGDSLHSVVEGEGSDHIIGIEFNRDEIEGSDGNIDAVLHTCTFFKLYTAIKIYGRNLTLNNSLFSHCVNGVKIYDYAEGTNVKGIIFNNTQFHTCSLWRNIDCYCIEDLSTRSQETSISSCIFDGAVGNCYKGSSRAFKAVGNTFLSLRAPKSTFEFTHNELPYDCAIILGNSFNSSIASDTTLQTKHHIVFDEPAMFNITGNFFGPTTYEPVICNDTNEGDIQQSVICGNNFITPAYVSGEHILDNEAVKSVIYIGGVGASVSITGNSVRSTQSYDYFVYFRDSGGTFQTKDSCVVANSINGASVCEIYCRGELLAELNGVKSTYGDTRPNILKGVYKGKTFFDTTWKKPYFWDGSTWINALGLPIGKESGLTESRPTLDSILRGAQYFDATLGKPIWWNGTAWVDATGATV